MVGKDVGQHLTVFLLQKILNSAFWQSCESCISRCEDGEGAIAFQCFNQACCAKCGGEGFEITRCNSGVDDVTTVWKHDGIDDMNDAVAALDVRSDNLRTCKVGTVFLHHEVQALAIQSGKEVRLDDISGHDAARDNVVSKDVLQHTLCAGLQKRSDGAFG